MIWWFYLVVVAWAYTAAILRSPLTITNTVLILTGISAATGLSSMTIDKAQRTQDSKPSVPRSSGNLLYDLVTDGHGVAVHRFQMLVWTVVLGTYFVVYVLNKMAMPEFDTSLLILMGISSGSYVAMKTQESGNGT